MQCDARNVHGHHHIGRVQKIRLSAELVAKQRVLGCFIRSTLRTIQEKYNETKSKGIEFNCSFSHFRINLIGLTDCRL